ncbi:protease modulator HflC [Novosphingobium sp. FSY-8]|uniref:Protein HflC n=1 Tax=Novosphingobium ovatum TaxID=1908523 RepID=A0ABW9XDH5_9SPHN|nr:protease modulator HflC [Novosphingobium ovatum]NBC36589.1 protease modulator HflC [Novosphingobium ovatum]
MSLIRQFLSRDFGPGAKLGAAGLIALGLMAMTSVVVVPETQQAVVVRLGQPNRVINRYHPGQPFGQTGAGMSLRLPFVETVVLIDKRVLSVEMDRQKVTSSDQQRLDVDAYARYRIIDPLRMVRTAGTAEKLQDQLQPILNSALRQGLASHTFQSLLTPERGAMMAQIRQALDHEARAYGVQVIDVRIKRADLPDGAPLERAFAQMEAARDQEATAIRATGMKRAQIIEADAEARAAKIYADSFGKDPAFYDFYRAMKSYEATFTNPQGKGSSTIILTPDNEYLRQFRAPRSR